MPFLNDNHDLTPREREVFNMFLAGKTPKEIAYELKISYNTVSSHQKSIYRKLGVQCINELLVKFRDVNQQQAKEPLFSENASFNAWVPICDSSSTINVQTENGIAISGMRAGLIGHWAGVLGFPDASTLQALKTMKSFSFKAEGDGSNYYLLLPTEDTGSQDHWLHPFNTVKDKIITIKVNVPKDLTRIGFSGKHVEFNQNNIKVFSFEAASSGSFNLKVWDIKIN